MNSYMCINACPHRILASRKLLRSAGCKRMYSLTLIEALAEVAVDQRAYTHKSTSQRRGWISQKMNMADLFQANCTLSTDEEGLSV
eukprot:4032-Heterococcus_DN1.PRE.2